MASRPVISPLIFKTLILSMGMLLVFLGFWSRTPYVRPRAEGLEWVDRPYIFSKGEAQALPLPGSAYWIFGDDSHPDSGLALLVDIGEQRDLAEKLGKKRLVKVRLYQDHWLELEFE